MRNRMWEGYTFQGGSVACDLCDGFAGVSLPAMLTLVP